MPAPHCRGSGLDQEPSPASWSRVGGDLNEQVRGLQMRAIMGAACARSAAIAGCPFGLTASIIFLLVFLVFLVFLLVRTGTAPSTKLADLHIRLQSETSSLQKATV